MHNNFSYQEYKKIISFVKEHLPIIDYSEVTHFTEKFCVIRHDVEFSVDRAYELALLEHSLGIKTSYMFQIRNNCYNTFSNKNLKKIKSIVSMGHKIGLHAHMDMLKDINLLKDYIINDINILSLITGINIDRFSFHRPKKEYLKLNLKIDKIINTYDKKYFHFSEKLDKLRVIYLADSQHKWSYGHPLNINLTSINKLQLNTHPYSWTNKGFDNKQNFITLLSEKNDELKNSINNECKNFPL